MASHGCYRDGVLVCRVVVKKPAPYWLLAVSAKQRPVGRMGDLQRRAGIGGVAGRTGRDEHSRREEN